MNAWFALINSVNLLFGSYFFYQAFNTGAPMIEAQPRAAPLIYSAAYFWLSSITENPLPIIQVGLGLVPILFSFFFWLIPALRFARLGAENRKIRRRNLRKAGFRLIWEKIRGLRPADIGGPSPEYGETEGERIIVEMGTYSQPEVEADERGTVYNFTGLEGEKKALAAGRDKVDPEDFKIGGVVFDSE
jgi:hypothetical protein